jgi:hypothetical protein
MKMDIRQEAPRHADAMNTITEYLGMGSYNEWDEEKKIAFLVRRRVSPPLLLLNFLINRFLMGKWVRGMLLGRVGGGAGWQAAADSAHHGDERGGERGIGHI